MQYFLSEIPRCKQWYTHNTDVKSFHTVVLMKHVLSADLEMLPMTKERELPLKMGRDKKIATKFKSVQMSNE